MEVVQTLMLQILMLSFKKMMLIQNINIELDMEIFHGDDAVKLAENIKVELGYNCWIDKTKL